MSNDLYEDLTDEEKALLKREMKHRIAQQKSREKVQAQMPAILIASAISCIALSGFLAFVTRSPWDKDGFNEQMFFPILIPSGFMILFAVGLWLWRQYKALDDKDLKNKSPKNKRG